MTVTQDEKAVREFSGRADGRADARADESADPGRGTDAGRHLDRLVRFMEPELDLEDVVLEVPAGNAPVSRAIASRVRHVTALDPAADLLAEGKRAADHAGLMNITFARGDAADLPYVDRSFTLVVTRFSLHLAADPEAVVAELARVGRPGAALIIADRVRPEGLEGDPDRIERLRDPSHAALLTEARIAEMLAASGAEVKRTERFDRVRPLDAWLESAGTPEDVAARIRRELRDELEGGPATGMRPSMVDGVLHVTHTCVHHQAIVG
ncbi:MAG TPA: methyltransferase domain-containing protein [Spirillospora sp.]